MKYAVIRQDGVTEIREDDHALPDGAIVLNDEQYHQLTSGAYILQNGQIVANPNPPRTV
jgi:hypothetical protein